MIAKQGVVMSKRINPYKRFQCSLIPEWLECRSSKELSDGAKLVYARLSRFCGENGHCYPKLELLSRKVGKSLAQVKRCIKELREKKLIESIRVGKKCANRYYFLEHPWMNEGIYLESDGSDMTSHKNSERSHMSSPMDGSHMSSPQKENQERESIYIVTKSKKTKNVQKNDERWKEYSKPFETKAKTGDCDKKLNSLSKSEYELLIKQRDKYLLFIRNERQRWAEYPMKNASTFLTKKYWKNATWENSAGTTQQYSISSPWG